MEDIVGVRSSETSDDNCHFQTVKENLALISQAFIPMFVKESTQLLHDSQFSGMIDSNNIWYWRGRGVWQRFKIYISVNINFI